MTAPSYLFFDRNGLVRNKPDRKNARKISDKAISGLSEIRPSPIRVRQ
jgi:hypothetical protein